MNVGGLRQRRHYINKCYSDFAVYRNYCKCKAGEEEGASCSTVTANKPNGNKSRYRSILMKYIAFESTTHQTQECLTLNFFNIHIFLMQSSLLSKEYKNIICLSITHQGFTLNILMKEVNYQNISLHIQCKTH